MDDDELDEYITKGVGDDDDGKNKKNKRLEAPDVAGIDRWARDGCSAPLTSYTVCLLSRVVHELGEDTGQEDDNSQTSQVSQTTQTSTLIPDCTCSASCRAGSSSWSFQRMLTESEEETCNLEGRER